MLTISSLNNPAVKEVICLKKSGERKKTGLFLIDGRREISAALKAGWEIKSLFYSPVLAEGKTPPAQKLALNGNKIIEVTEAIFKKMCYKENPDGFLAIAKSRKIGFSDVKIGPKALIVVLEKVEKPGNLGAILRTAYAVGATAIIINDGQTDIYNPNVIRASEGQVFTQPVIAANISETVNWLKFNKIKSFAAATGGSKKYTQVNFSDSVAIVLGSESLGLSQDWLAAADNKIKIPMREGIDSLNVSVAAAVILFEVLRQRG